MAHKLGQRTLVIVHTSMLRDQWVGEIQKLFGIQAGILGGGSKSYDNNCPIVVANIQTLIKVADTLTNEFGTVIVDEAHHTPASTFTDTLDLLKARYRIALSGTMQRKDGKHILFRDYFGTKIYAPPRNNTINPKIQVVKTGRRLLPGAAYAQKINHLLNDPDYIDFIVAVAKIKIAQGHKVLIVAERVEFLRQVSKRLGDQCILIIGETAYEAERNRMAAGLEDGSLTSVAGSRQIFSEGISVNILSCLILASPIGSLPLLEQIIGRIMRLHPDKPEPIVVDMHFIGTSENRQNNLRLGFYLQQGWEVMAV